MSYTVAVASSLEHLNFVSKVGMIDGNFEFEKQQPSFDLFLQPEAKGEKETVSGECMLTL